MENLPPLVIPGPAAGNANPRPTLGAPLPRPPGYVAALFAARLTNPGG